MGVLGNFEGHDFHACDGLERGEGKGMDDVMGAGGQEVERVLRDLGPQGDICGSSS